MHEKARNAEYDDPMYDGLLFSMDKRTKAISNWKNLQYRLVIVGFYRELMDAQHA